MKPKFYLLVITCIGLGIFIVTRSLSDRIYNLKVFLRVLEDRVPRLPLQDYTGYEAQGSVKHGFVRNNSIDPGKCLPLHRLASSNSNDTLRLDKDLRRMEKLFGEYIDELLRDINGPKPGPWSSEMILHHSTIGENKRNLMRLGRIVLPRLLTYLADGKFTNQDDVETALEVIFGICGFKEGCKVLKETIDYQRDPCKRKNLEQILQRFKERFVGVTRPRNPKRNVLRSEEEVARLKVEYALRVLKKEIDWPSDEVCEYYLNKVTGKRFISVECWEQWWEQNADKLKWDPKLKRFVEK